MNEEELMRAASAAHTIGDLAEAQKLARQVLDLNSESVPATLLLGVLLAKTGRSEEARTELNKVLTYKPDSYEALVWLSMVERKAHNFTEAVDFAQRAMGLRPREAHAHNNLGMIYLESGNAEGAVESFGRAVAISPNVPSVQCNLGLSLLLLNRNEKAEAAFKTALSLAPNTPDARFGLGKSLFRQHRYTDALENAQLAHRMNPNSASIHILLANILVSVGRPVSAEAYLRAAMQIEPNSVEARNGLAIFLQEMGRFKEAEAELQSSFELQPNQGTAYYCLAQSKKITDEDAGLVQSMEAVDAEKLDLEERRMLHYGLAKAYENLGRYQDSMTQFDIAHDITFQKVEGRYNREEEERFVNDTTALYTKEFMLKTSGRGIDTELPIIICGMIRSGTTLCEQIVSSHPDVGPAGEQFFWLERGARGDFDANKLQSWAEQYVEQLEGIAPGFKHVTDKMPGNHRHLGLIHLALPKAKIIHMKRDPLDTCLSIYTTRINRPPVFGRTREDIAFAYKQYERLMSHWRALLPAGSFMEVNYEDLVSDGEPVIRRILEFLDLPWNEMVLRHEVNARNVKTPSLWAVRQPLNRGSVERWRHFEPWLGALLEAR
ncbi:MAG TPA: sulfotransferase [Fimbriimonadaceae bacterium]